MVVFFALLNNSLTMKRFAPISLLLILGLVPPAVAVEYKIDPVAMSKLPILGNSCDQQGKVISSQFNKFECKSEGGELTWHVSALQYRSPDTYIKGYEIGKKLKRDNPNVSANALICKNAAEGKVVKDFQVQNSKVSKADIKIISDYYGYLGCWEGYSNGGKAPSKISLANPTGKRVVFRDGVSATPIEDLRKINNLIVDAFQVSTTAGIQKLSEFLYQDAFSLGATWDECFTQRESENWRIVSQSLTPHIPQIGFRQHRIQIPQ
jgi:hypothetical protein